MTEFLCLITQKTIDNIGDMFAPPVYIENITSSQLGRSLLKPWPSGRVYYVLVNSFSSALLDQCQIKYNCSELFVSGIEKILNSANTPAISFYIVFFGGDPFAIKADIKDKITLAFDEFCSIYPAVAENTRYTILSPSKPGWVKRSDTHH